MNDSPAPIIKRESARVICTLTFGESDRASAEEKALEHIGSNLNLKGFRPGKAPLAAVRENVKADALFEETVHTLIQATVPKLLEQEKLRPIISPRVEVTARIPLTVKVTVVERPSVTVKGLEKIKIEKKPIVVDEKSKKRVIDSVLSEEKTMKEIDGKAKTGDQVTIDFSASDEAGQAVNGFAGSAYAVLIGDAHLLPGFEEQLTGLGHGDEKKFPLTLPSTHPSKEMQNKVLTFSVRVLKVEEVSLPELTDAFAKAKLGMESAAAFVSTVEKTLRQQEENVERMRREQLLLTEIKNRTQVELAQELIDEETRGILQELEEELKNKNQTLADWMKQQGKDAKVIEKDMRTKAEDRLKLRFGISTVIEEKKIEVNREEMKDTLRSFLSRIPAEQRSGAEKNYAEGSDGWFALQWQKKVEKAMEMLLA